MARNIILLILFSLLISGCSEDKNPVGQAGGFITGRVTIDGVGIAGVTITASVFSTTGGGTGKVESSALLSSTTADGDYSLEVLPGIYKIEFSVYQGLEYLHKARYPINVSSGQETTLNVDLKDSRPSSLLARDGDGNVNLSFEPGYSIDSYRIYRAVSGSEFELVSELYDSSSYTIYVFDTPPSVGLYIYRVAAIIESVETEPSNEADVNFTANIA
ncbi:MAG: carboxypeptidase-like regulatory domain-containing protein, partial [candidate division Zixibacteria bacterium]